MLDHVGPCGRCTVFTPRYDRVVGAVQSISSAVCGQISACAYSLLRAVRAVRWISSPRNLVKRGQLAAFGLVQCVCSALCVAGVLRAFAQFALCRQCSALDQLAVRGRCSALNQLAAGCRCSALV